MQALRYFASVNVHEYEFGYQHLVEGNISMSLSLVQLSSGKRIYIYPCKSCLYLVKFVKLSGSERILSRVEKLGYPMQLFWKG